MNTEEATKLRARLEQDIFQRLRDFKKATGLHPVSVEVVSDTAYSVQRRQTERLLHGVRVEVML